MDVEVRHSSNDERSDEAELTGDFLLVFHRDTEWRCDSHREMYDRIVDALGYDPEDVYEVRVAETAIEVDFIDFEDAVPPVITRQHRAITS